MILLSQNGLAELYGVETRVLNQAVTRDTMRFPENFMFKLSDQEFAYLKSQTVTSRWGGPRKLASNQIWISHKRVRKSFDRFKKVETVSLNLGLYHYSRQDFCSIPVCRNVAPVKF